MKRLLDKLGEKLKLDPPFPGFCPYNWGAVIALGGTRKHECGKRKGHRGKHECAHCGARN